MSLGAPACVRTWAARVALYLFPLLVITAAEAMLRHASVRA